MRARSALRRCDNMIHLISQCGSRAVVEQPEALPAVLAKTAKALGLTIPQPLLQRADEVIQ